MKVLKYKRGQIWWYKTSSQADGSIQAKTRPVIILSNDKANYTSKCLIGIPCTTQEKKALPTHVSFEIEGLQNISLAENMMSINTERLGDYIGNVDDELLKKLEYSVKIALGFEEAPKETTYTNVLTSDITTNWISNTAESIKSNNTEDEEENKIIEVNINRKRMTEDEKHRFLNDYENHDKEYMLKKYDIKDSRALANKIYMIRKEFGLGVRNR